MKFIKAGDNLIINIETIRWAEKDNYGYWTVHLAGEKGIQVRSEEFTEAMEELCFESANHRRSSTGSSCVDVIKLTESVFDRYDCPEWAEYAAVDAAGEVWAFAFEPFLNDENSCWVCPADDYESSVFIAAGYDATDWRNSLIKRPRHS